MSRLLIGQYLNDLSRLKQVSGTHRESVVREAFKDLLKGYARSHELVFVPEFEIESPAKERRYVDGALLHQLRLPFGYWEAKDEKDDLDAEIATKFKRGYPKDNIIFEDSTQAVLIQNGGEVIRCKVDDVDALQKLLGVFFAYQRPEIGFFRKAVEQFTTDLPQVLDALRAMIDTAHAGNPAFGEAALTFLSHAQKTINPSLVFDDVREILIQHILTDEIFDTVFPGQVFHKDNNVAQELHKLEDTFFTGNTKHQLLKRLEVYYAAIRSAAARIGSHHEKQTFLKVVYENFYKVYNPKAADRLGVVYTPGEIVRFMIESADWLCEHHFKRNLIDRDVEILDPAVGTGTFITELIEHFRGQPAKLRHKYAEELHANEVGILPYYVANLNIEATYAAITGEYVEFPGLCLVDTLDNVAGLGRKTGDHVADLFGMGDENVERIKRQNRRKISVIIGNPPYNANQLNENDNNKNRVYPEIDRRIKDSYIKASTAQKTKLYDMYSRFFRWASDRMHDDGVLAFITNRSFLDARTFDGFRKIVAQEFAEIRVVDLGGDVRANPKLSGTKHNVFGIQTGVAISFLVKKRGSKGARIFYTRRPELETAEEKLSFLTGARLGELAMEEVTPDKTGNWLNLTNNDFETLLPLASKAAKRSKTLNPKALFRVFSQGVKTNRDEWVAGFNSEDVLDRVGYLLTEYNSEARRLRGKVSREDVASKINYRIKWTRKLKQLLVADREIKFDESCAVDSLYRPFVKLKTYFAWELNEDWYQLEALFPSGLKESPYIAFVEGQRLDFSVIAGNVLPNYAMFSLDPVQCIPLHAYQDGQRLDNITDWALKQFRDHYQQGKSTPPQPSPATQGREQSFAPPAAQGEQGFAPPAAQGEQGFAPPAAQGEQGFAPPAAQGEQGFAPPAAQGEQGFAPPAAQGAQGLSPHAAQGAQGLSPPLARSAGGGWEGVAVDLPPATQDDKQKRPITKQAIFHYVYAVLHDPLYREKYAQNLKREFPRIRCTAVRLRTSGAGPAGAKR